MTSYLVMQLYGPLVAWGEQAVGGVRRTADHPSKSAILGLCAAARGIRRDHDTALKEMAESLRFGVKVITPGGILKDYHTTQAPPQNKKIRHWYTRHDELRETRLGTILSSREYRQDALALAALWQADGDRENLDDLAAQLKIPVFQLYLGRKACPLAIPLNPMIIEADALDTAFAEYPEPRLADGDVLAVRLGRSVGTLYWEASEYSGMDDDSYDFRVPRYDQPVSRTRWQFASRDEYVRLGDGSEP